MSELANVSAEIAPYLALAANSMGTSVLTAAQQRIAERTVTAGEGFFRRLLRRDDGTDSGLGDGAAPTRPRRGVARRSSTPGARTPSTPCSQASTTRNGTCCPPP
ncbi:hypothetical protein O1L68_16330 [Streptomyces lydicus]|nr:hypothetical protein [Streptomyces lydicus]